MFRYRKPENSGLFRGLRRTMAVTAFVVGASFCIAGSSWHSSSIFYYTNQLPIPWWGYGVFLLIGGVCMFIPHIRPIGFLLGAIIYTFFALTIWLGVLGGLHSDILFLKYLHSPSNNVASFYAACNATTICALYWSALKHSIYQQADPDRNLSQFG